ncbi:hypothetical protein KIL84_020182 [Mauremys mutica]|uniref:Uncharacterized protein n=1 Tax=Mauremys mutica TaxID=74926 RepID=A0A9D3XY00_9SAUR|nr:hypothetical protein KIL84_020182 [Mauremys mutica]
MKLDALLQEDEYYKPGEETMSMILKPSDFISGTIASNLLSSIRSQLPSNPFAISTCQALDNDHPPRWIQSASLPVINYHMAVVRIGKPLLRAVAAEAPYEWCGKREDHH